MDSAKHLEEAAVVVLLFAHGSAVEEANEKVRQLAGRSLEGHSEMVSLLLSRIREVTEEVGVIA